MLSPKNAALREALYQAIDHENPGQWRQILRKDSTYLSDPLAIIDDIFTDIAERSSYSGGSGSINDWMKNAQEWVIHAQDPNVKLSANDHILYETWQHIANQQGHLISKARKFRDPSIPELGYLILFACGLSKHVIVEYRASGPAIDFRVVKSSDKPQAFFDITDIAGVPDLDLHTDVKALLNSGHKIVVHRGVLVHVDRREDLGVFGPTIDTLVLAEVLAQQLFEKSEYTISRALEIGCGNGLLTCSIATHCADLQELFAIDNHFESISCTRKNLSVALGGNSRASTNFFLTYGSFTSDLFNRNFDLVVCNPPYIPLPAHMRESRARTPDYFTAVGGTALLRAIVKSSSDILAPGGRMLVLTSSLSLSEALECAPKGCKIEFPFGDQGYEVLFDVEATRKRKDLWNFLLGQEGLIKRDGRYFHKLHPMWLEKAR